VTWVRAAFQAKKDASAIHDSVGVKNCRIGKRNPKEIQFCIEMFRQALMMNYETKALVYFEPVINSSWKICPL
jgi:DNA polymerase-3 subunit delta'